MLESAWVTITALHTILIIVDIVGNSIVCAIIKQNQDMRLPVNYLLVNLAVADMMVATFFAPMQIFIHTFTHPDGVLGSLLCKLLTGGSFAWIGAASSAFTLVAIAVERFYAVNSPYGSRWKLTNNRLKAIVFVSWLFALIINIPEFMYSDFNQNFASCLLTWPEKWMRQAYSILSFMIFGVLPIPIMDGLYAKVVYNLWFKRNQDSQLSHHQQGVLRMQKRVTLMVVIVSVIFSICWLTGAILYLLTFYSTADTPSGITYSICCLMVMLNSAVNPFVYALLNQRFREKFKRMICCSLRSSNQIHSSSYYPAG